MENLKQDIESFQKCHLNNFLHAQWIKTSEGAKICNFIINLIGYVQDLEYRIEELENNIQSK